MSGLSAFMIALALVLWTKATVTQASTIVTSSFSASASATIPDSKDVTSSSVVPTSVSIQASKNATSSPVASASDAIQASKSVSRSPAASPSVTIPDSKDVTSSSVVPASVSIQASKNATRSPVAPASVTIQVFKTDTSNPVASASVTIQASKSVTSSPVHVASASLAVEASKIIPSNASTFASRKLNVTIIVTGSLTPHLTPEISSSVNFNKTSEPSTQASPNASSFTSSPNTTKSLPTAAVSATTFTSQSVSKFSAAVVGQTSKTSMPPSSVVPSPSVSQSTQVGTSTLAQSKETVSVMTHLVGSLTVSTSNSSSTSSPTINTTSASSPATPTTPQPTAPTLPPGGTKFVSMEVSFDIEFKEEYSDTGSPEYKELKDNLTTSLEKVYKNVDGFVSVRILFITKGSVVCSYIVILAKDSEVKPSELKEKLQQASDSGELFRVKSVKVEEDASEETEEKLPKWALVVMIVLGCLSAVFLVTVIYLCVKYRRSLYGGSEAYLVSSGEIGLAHTYDRVSIGDNKNGANQGTAQKPAAGRRVIGSHTNPTYGSNGALAD